MNAMKLESSPCLLLGDVVGSRGATDRRALHDAVERALRTVNEAVPAVRPLRVTVGDEFQSSYASLGGALEAALCVHLELRPHVDTRIGLGRGEVTVLDAERGIEDGPGWWAAREAIEAVEEAAARPATRRLRTAYRVRRMPGTVALAGRTSSRGHGQRGRGRQRGPALSGPSGWLVVRPVGPTA